MSKILREKSEVNGEFVVKYDNYYERHKIISNWTDEQVGKFKKTITDNIAGIGVPEDEVLKNYSEFLTIFSAWMLGNTTEYDQSIFKRLKFSQISPNKGFYIMGEKGTGKTTFMNAFRNAFKKYVKQFDYQGFKKVSGFDIKNEYASYGVRTAGYEGFVGGVEKLFTPWHKETGREFEVLYIDDLLYDGENKDTSHYGNSTNVLEDVIKARFDKGLLTFATSNFSPSKFSEPVVDRFKESMNIIAIAAEESFRK